MNLLGFLKGVWDYRLTETWMFQKKLHHWKPSPVMGYDLWKLYPGSSLHTFKADHLAGEYVPSNNYHLFHLGIAVGTLKNLKLPKTYEFC